MSEQWIDGCSKACSPFVCLSAKLSSPPPLIVAVIQGVFWPSTVTRRREVEGAARHLGASGSCFHQTACWVNVEVGRAG